VVGGHVGGGQQVPSALEGFAAVSGAGHGPTTGGSGGPTVTVTSLAQLQTAAARSGPEVIKVNGLFSGRGGSRWPPTRPSSAWAPTPGSPASACR
jgi:pectate lyase